MENIDLSDPMRRLARAEQLLRAGDLGRGFFEHDRAMRQLHPSRGVTLTDRPRWDGSALPDATILLYPATCGHGDAIQFIRYAKLVRERVGTVILYCHEEQASLFAEADGLDRVVTVGAAAKRPALVEHDIQSHLMGLPAIFRTTLETIPAKVPYLAAPAGSVEKWRAAFAGLSGLKVGVAWQGSPRNALDRFRSFPLAALAPLAQVPGVSFVSLQRGHGTEQMASAGFPIRIPNDAHDGSWGDTAAIISELDLVIAPDTGIAHLAGALGKPAWVALPEPAEWRWLTDRDDSPWYPSMRIFRQGRPGDWAGLFGRMAEALGRLLVAEYP